MSTDPFNAFTDRTPDRQGGAGPLAGRTFAAKNLFDVAGLPTRAGAALRRAAPPATRDAFAVRALEGAGARLLGTTNMDEFAFGFTTENSHDGPTRNPHDPARVAGGSSGGSAAAVAAGLVDVALGTDTNGSIRVPAALCGIFGLKPTFGRLSRAGAFPFVASFDHVGPLARDLGWLAAAYDALQGADPEDPAQAPRPVEPVGDAARQGLAGLSVARLAGHFEGAAEEACLAPARAAAALLGATETIAPPLATEARAAALLITLAEAGALHLPALRTQADAYDPLVRDRLLAGALLPAAWVIDAQRVRARFASVMRAVFTRFDVLVAPAVPTRALPIGTSSVTLAGETFPARPHLGWFTQPISAIGLPAMAVPCAAMVEGLPVGVQLIAAPWREDHLFRAAGALVAAGFAASPDILRKG
jgi:AtzE family amidohydrolase